MNTQIDCRLITEQGSQASISPKIIIIVTEQDLKAAVGQNIFGGQIGLISEVSYCRLVVFSDSISLLIAIYIVFSFIKSISPQIAIIVNNYSQLSNIKIG